MACNLSILFKRCFNVGWIDQEKPYNGYKDCFEEETDNGDLTWNTGFHGKSTYQVKVKEINLNEVLDNTLNSDITKNGDIKADASVESSIELEIKELLDEMKEEEEEVMKSHNKVDSDDKTVNGLHFRNGDLDILQPGHKDLSMVQSSGNFSVKHLSEHFSMFDSDEDASNY